MQFFMQVFLQWLYLKSSFFDVPGFQDVPFNLCPLGGFLDRNPPKPCCMFEVSYGSLGRRFSDGFPMNFPFSHGFPMVFLWFSYGFPIFLPFSKRFEVNFDYWSSPQSVPWSSDGPRLEDLGERWDTESQMSPLVSAKFFASLEAKGNGSDGGWLSVVVEGAMETIGKP